jgi:AraC family transcriptional regulator
MHPLRSTALKTQYRHIRPQTVLFARSHGPYATGTVEAWRTMGGWLDARGGRPLMRVSYGLFHDDPHATPSELLRYDACVPQVFGLVEDEDTLVRRQMLPGGTYVVHLHVGAIEETGAVFSALQRKEIPVRGLTVDDARPFMCIYLTDPTVTRSMHRRTEVCVPVLPIRMLGAGNDDGEVTSAIAGTA